MADNQTKPGEKTLVIAEKRSVGRTIAAFLGCRADHGSWIGGDAYDVTWAQGHLLRLLMPDEYGEHEEWRSRDVHVLPLVPDADGWRWEVSRERGADAQYEALASLAEHLQSGPAWAGLTAVKEGRCFVLPKDLFHYKPCERWGESYHQLAEMLYGAE